MLYASNLFNSLIFASLLFVKLLMFLLKNSFDDKYFLKIMVDNWGFYSKWIEWMGFLSVVWLWRIRGGNSQVMMGLVLRGYFSTYFPFTYLPMIFPSLSKSMMSQGILSAVPFLSNYLECGRLSEFLLFFFFVVKFLCL